MVNKKSGKKSQYGLFMDKAFWLISCDAVGISYDYTDSSCKPVVGNAIQTANAIESDINGNILVFAIL